MGRKKKRSGKWLVLVSLLVLSLVFYKQVIRYSYKLQRAYRQIVFPPDVKSGFIAYPLGYALHGIDVSRWQDEVDWTALKARDCEGDTMNFSFAFIKATEGIWLEDPLFDENWKSAGKNKISRGAYHYFLPDADPVKQARNFISSVKLKKGDLPPVIDVEEIRGKSKQDLVKQLNIYIGEIEKHYKVRPILYSGINFIENYLSDDFSDYNFWVAHYYEDELVIASDIKWLFWQHSDKATMVGCRYYVDVNVFNGTRSDFEMILIR